MKGRREFVAVLSSLTDEDETFLVEWCGPRIVLESWPNKEGANVRSLVPQHRRLLIIHSSHSFTAKRPCTISHLKSISFGTTGRVTYYPPTPPSSLLSLPSPRVIANGTATHATTA